MPNIRLVFQRLIPFLGYHHVLMTLLAASWILLAFLLAGCTSSTGAMSNIYVLGLHYNNTVGPLDDAGNASNITASEFKLRVGYFGLCARRSDETQWFCASGRTGIQSVIAETNVDTLSLTEIGGQFKSDVLFSGLLITSMALTALSFLGLATFPGWHEEHDARTGSDIDIKPFPSEVSRACALLLMMASMLLLVSALWQHVAAASVVATISSMSQGRLVAHVGAAAVALVWVALALVAVAFLGLYVMILSIHILDRLTDE